ncbi:CBY1-interacting BAR domain-containing protein 2-like [Odontesthes bonariensis]|uniref:CBY1-interacting BAR domain-containing protein 2-like n=1 Tax=Odontesthes bonariensis TaxID=219752 RepID=UPI003F586F01
MNSFISRREVQVRSMEQTMKHAEKNLGEICSLLASYTRKTAKLRDKADLLVAQLFDISSTEDPELQIGLKIVAEDLAMVQDYRQAQIERLETRVVHPLKAYGEIVKNKRTNLKKFSTDLDREQKELQKLEKIRRRNPADRQSISQAEVNVQKASNNAQHSMRKLEETITEFQKQKLEDIKRIFTDFITVEMLFHAKALEVFTHTHCNLEAINTQKDLELFTGRIRMTDSQAGHQDSPLSTHSSHFISHYSNSPLASLKTQGLSSMQASNTGQRHRQQYKQYKEVAKRVHGNLQHQRGTEELELEQEEDDEDDDEEEIEGEEQDESESDIEKGRHTSRQSYAAQYAQMHR